MERPANALTAEDLKAEAQKWIELSNGKSVLVGRVSVADVLRAATQIPAIESLLMDEEKAAAAKAKGDKADRVIKVANALKEAEAAEKIVVMGLIEPRVTAERVNGSACVRDFKREDVVTMSNEILALSGYTPKEAKEAAGFSGTPD